VIEKSPLLNKPDYLVCTCFGVMCSEVEAAVDAGADSFGKLQDQLMVGTGCSSCVDEVKEILASSLKNIKKS
jgi:bacterioferritin-associated ferredoxin